MREVEAARAHLRGCQATLRIARTIRGGRVHEAYIKHCQDQVFAALSWVDDAQERDREAARIASFTSVPVGKVTAERYIITPGGAYVASEP